eukprot:1142168-Pelagomonas_calceolata.AAC.11
MPAHMSVYRLGEGRNCDQLSPQLLEVQGAPVPRKTSPPWLSPLIGGRTCDQRIPGLLLGQLPQPLGQQGCQLRNLEGHARAHLRLCRHTSTAAAKNSSAPNM